MSPNELSLVAKHVMKLLVERRFDELETATNGKRLSADDIEGAVDDIGGKLVMPPEPSWKDLRITPVRNWQGAFALVLQLWTANGRTPHSVELTVHTKNGEPVIELDDIIVQ
ncbi:MAG: hypothetical protein KBA60_07515 [Flavobacteriales bacterium]|jgi:hypothetical protein|nr:hypothetical protein [Flavobacteriales bacterium]MBP7155838.1 hypothetical protein [Flavobacteriales bacterium]HQV75734.1 hypothetical protein [Flavobacteriales bacterium]HQW40499.1 hypothetical protein [Flavobacteriales bacterium]